jgi:hypothetical protein
MAALEGGFKKITVGAAVVQLNGSNAAYAAVPDAASANTVDVFVEGQPIRVRFDGSDPTATDGHLVGAGQSFTVTGEADCDRLRAVRDTAASGDAVVHMTLGRT